MAGRVVHTLWHFGVTMCLFSLWLYTTSLIVQATTCIAQVLNCLHLSLMTNIRCIDACGEWQFSLTIRLCVLSITGGKWITVGYTGGVIERFLCTFEYVLCCETTAMDFNCCEFQLTLAAIHCKAAHWQHVVPPLKPTGGESFTLKIQVFGIISL